jgi:hypothetical protein
LDPEENTSDNKVSYTGRGFQFVPQKARFS